MKRHLHVILHCVSCTIVDIPQVVWGYNCYDRLAILAVKHRRSVLLYRETQYELVKMVRCSIQIPIVAQTQLHPRPGFNKANTAS
ncbi:hypothetical protein F4806DRAFT_17586 [Annulohypoxylon nitens]|nr:hypothetical protein F4806DRAFT_17586 [Annulohypoxylon nitens]